MRREHGSDRGLWFVWSPARPSVRLLTAPVRTVAFWLAIGIPLAYPPVLMHGGALDLLAFGGLLGLHAAALSLGHTHRRD